ncbi:MAG: HAD-IB family phosphatase [Magnetococcales bacterium]|nr:HAD-IB family phosphatase [Magnetococcales bacterium]
MKRGVAVFDFDRTLVRQETLALFLRTIAGRRMWMDVAAAAAHAAFVPSQRRMEVFRAQLLRCVLAGRTLEQAQDAAEVLFCRLDWISQTCEALISHRQAGRRILVATGSLSIYMPILLNLKGLPVDALLSTEMCLEGNTITGEVATPSCTWEEKARRVRQWLTDVDGPVWGYGNLPHDGAMLALTDHPTVVPT